MDEQPDPDKNPSPLKSLLLPYIVVVVVFLLLYALFYNMKPPTSSFAIPYSEFKSYVEDNRVDKVTLMGDAIQGSFFDPQPIGPKGQTAKRFTSRMPAFGDTSLLPTLEKYKVQVEVKKAAGEGGNAFSYIIGLLPWLVFFLVFFWLIRRASKRMAAWVAPAN
jgi:ATP-dependent Zn protease